MRGGANINFAPLRYWHLFRADWRSFLIYEALCWLLSVLVFSPISAMFLREILRWSGDNAVSNYDLLSFFMSPTGLFLIAVTGTASFALLFIELGGLAIIAVGVRNGAPVSALRTLQLFARHLRGLCDLGLRQFLVVGAILSTILVAVLVANAVFLGGGDFYYYYSVRPPAFWWAVLAVGIVAIVAAFGTAYVLVRWMFAVPILVLEGGSVGSALKESGRAVRAISIGKILGKLAGWLATVLIIVAMFSLMHGLLERTLMAIAGNRVDWVMAMAGAVLAADLVLALITGLFASLSIAMLIAGLYCAGRPDARVADGLSKIRSGTGRTTGMRRGTAGFLLAIALLGLSGILTATIFDKIQINENVAVTAHRGSATTAPENTLSAIRQAIADGADYAEIDVQQTSDGVVVLLHDTDLRRVAGDSRRVWEITYAELSKLDVGSWFAPSFAEERIATLDQVIEAAQGRIALNIEMKFNGHDRDLEAAVARSVADAAFHGQSVVSSLDYPGLQNVGRADSRLKTGLIVTAVIGDPTSLDVDFLAVNERAVSRDLVTRAHRAGKQVHVWSVTNPARMLTMIHMGVDNILTPTPALAVALLRERAKLSDAEKTMLLVSDILAGRL